MHPRIFCLLLTRYNLVAVHCCLSFARKLHINDVTGDEKLSWNLAG